MLQPASQMKVEGLTPGKPDPAAVKAAVEKAAAATAGGDAGSASSATKHTPPRGAWAMPVSLASRMRKHEKENKKSDLNKKADKGAADVARLQALAKQLVGAKPEAGGCWKCGGGAGEPAEGKQAKLVRCSRCKLAYYCDIECQKGDLKRHAKPCKAAAALAEQTKRAAAAAAGSEGEEQEALCFEREQDWRQAFILHKTDLSNGDGTAGAAGQRGVELLPEGGRARHSDSLPLHAMVAAVVLRASPSPVGEQKQEHEEEHILLSSDSVDKRGDACQWYLPIARVSPLESYQETVPSNPFPSSLLSSFPPVCSSLLPCFPRLLVSSRLHSFPGGAGSTGGRLAAAAPTQPAYGRDCALGVC